MSARAELACINPATGEALCSPIPSMTKEEVEDAVARSRAAQRDWARTSFRERRAVLQDLLDVIVDCQEEICIASCRETGKTMLEAGLGEILTTCEKIRYTIKHGEDMLRTEYRDVPLLLFTKQARVEYHPLGVIGTIIPWNYPFHNIYGPLVSALFAGNGVCVKVSEHAAWSAEMFGRYIKDVLQARGHDPELVQMIVGDGVAGEALVRSGVEKILFIGSPLNGKRVMRAASDNLTDVVLELGGKDPMIVCDDCDWDQAFHYTLRGVFINCGQNCLAAERIYIQDTIYDKFVAQVVETAQKLRQGPSLGSECVDCGAMTMPSQVPKVHELVQDAVARGARVLVGGEPNTEAGSYFYRPTVLADVNHSMRIVNEEAFGPVMLLLRWSNDDEVVDYANSTEYGLSSSIFSTNYERAERMANGIIAGSSIINDFGIPYLIQSLPFGGTKISGFGKFNGVEGMRGCCRQKAVVTDRFPLRTSMPRLLQYPTLKSAPGMLRDIVSAIYGNGFFKRAGGAVRFLKKLICGAPEDSE